MILNHLHLINYKQYTHLELEFREGLVGVIGKNGAGKSTIFEAILYCLFGKDESNKMLVKSSFATDPKANVALELAFSLGEIQYLVKREFRGKALAVGAELYKNDQLIAKGVTPVNEELVKVLQMERDAFKRSVFSGQKELSELSDTSGEARKKMVRKMLGLDTLDEVQSRVNSDIRDINQQIAGQRLNLLSDEAIEQLETELKTLNIHLKEKQGILKKENQTLQQISGEYQTKKQAFDAAAQKLNQHHTLERALAQANERLKGLTEQQEQLSAKINSLQSQQQQLEKDRPSFQQFLKNKEKLQVLETEKSRQINQKTVAARLVETRQHLAEIQEKTTHINQQLIEKDRVEQQLRVKQAEVATAEKDIEARRTELGDIKNRMAALNNSIAERQEKLTRLQAIGKAGACPTCMQPLLEGYERALAELSEQIHTIQSTELQELEQRKNKVIEIGTALKATLDAQRTESEKLLATHSRLTELGRQLQHENAQWQKFHDNLTRDELILREIGDVHFDETVYQQLKTELAAQESRFLDFQKSENYLHRELPAAQTSLKTTTDGLAEARMLAQQKTAEITVLAFDETQYQAAKTAFSGFDEALTKQSEVVRNLEKEVLETEHLMKRHQEKMQADAQIKSQIAGRLHEIELLRKLTEHLANFKTEILEKISPGISREASDLFSRITRGKYESIRVDENFDFAIADNGVYFPIERFSGGEVDLANFCLRIAITKAIMELSGSGHRLEFLAFDEIFGSQDEDRRLEMMLALNYLQEQFRQIYIVSHIESLRDYFPNLLEVQLGDHGSSVAWR